MHPAPSRRPACLSCQARIRKLHGGIAGLRVPFVRIISTPAPGSKIWQSPEAKRALKSCLLSERAYFDRDWSSRLVCRPTRAVTRPSFPQSNIVHVKSMQRRHRLLAMHFSVQAQQSQGAIRHSLMASSRRFNQCIREGHNVVRPDTEHRCISSHHSRPTRCNRSSCRSFALLKKFEGSDIVLVLGCSTGIIPSTIGMRIISAPRGNCSGGSVIPLASHVHILHV